MGVIQETAQCAKWIDPLRPEPSCVHHQGLFSVFWLCKFDRRLRGHADHPIVAAVDPVQQQVDMLMDVVEKGASVFRSRFPAGQIVVDPCQLPNGLGCWNVTADPFEGRFEFLKSPSGEPLLEKMRSIGSKINLFLQGDRGRVRCPGREFSMRYVDGPAEFVYDLVSDDLSCFVIEDPAHHTCIDREVQRGNGAAHDSKTIEFLDPRIAPLFFRADDGNKAFTVIVEHGHIGAQQRRIDDIQPFNHPPVGIDTAAQILIGAIRGALEFYLLNALKALANLGRELSQIPSRGR